MTDQPRVLGLTVRHTRITIYCDQCDFAGIFTDEDKAREHSMLTGHTTLFVTYGTNIPVIERKPPVLKVVE